MPMSDSRKSYLAIAISLLFVGCSGPQNNLIGYERALEISRKAAMDHGYDLSKYKLDTFGNPGAEDGKWLIVYLCAPTPPPGCSFMVVVDRKTGLTEVYPGM